MERKISLTADGSHTIAIPELGVTYHSVHGAIQESRHVFIEAGLMPAIASQRETNEPISILEVGFGTGLNCLLTVLAATKADLNINYHALELHPLTDAEAGKLNYTTMLNEPDAGKLFTAMHAGNWNVPDFITPGCSLQKIKVSLIDYQPDTTFDLIYFDAFAPDVQPELWTETIFRKLYTSMVTGGILTTYCSKGTVRRAMEAAGFRVEKLNGPPGKREMVRARK